MSKYSPGGILHAVKRGHGGVYPEHNKLTKDCEIIRIDPPETVSLPMSQHIGAPCAPTVAVGDVVSVGQVIGDSDKFISAPIHASVSGKVTSLKPVKLANGTEVPAVTIENDGEDRLFEGIEPPKVANQDDLVRAVRDSGLVGLGGAGFPSHVKLRFDQSKNIDTLVVNAAECEPYITVDYRECIDNSWDVFSGIYTLAELCGFKNVIIAVEDNKPEAIKILRKIADNDNEHDDVVKLMTLKSRYPQGAEKMMVLSATGRRVPPGKLPADVGCVVMNVASVAFIGRYLKTGKPLVSRSLTVSGGCIAKPGNVRAPIGTEIQKIIDFCGGFTDEPEKVLVGGPMMGQSIVSTSAPIVKSNNAILALSHNEDTAKRPESACIHCGRCASVCPMNLVPTNIKRCAEKKDAAGLNEAGVMVCMECGSCAFTCPASIPLVQYMRQGKAIVKASATR